MLDLPVLLRLADQGRIQVSDKTSLPGTTTLRLLTEKLAGGDFYADKPKQHKWDQEIGPIKVMQANGVIDVLVDDEAQAVAVAKDYLAYFQGPLADWSCAASNGPPTRSRRSP